MRPECMPGLVTTIVPVYNRPRLLSEAVASVLSQTYRPIEIVIVDDGSTDNTAAVAQALAAAHPEVRYLVQAHAGEPYAGCARGRNTGLAAARGEFIQFLDSDDVLMPAKFAVQVQALREHPECGISYGLAREYALGDPPPARPARQTGRTFVRLFPDLLRSRLWPSSAPLYRREVVAGNGPFEEVVNSDWEFECRIAARGVILHHSHEFLTDVRNTHLAEGRRQANVRRHALPRNLEAHERMLASASNAQIPPAILNHFARRLFALGRACGDSAFEAEARRCLVLARSTSSSRRDRALMAAYGRLSDQVGWQRVGSWCQRAEDAATKMTRRARAFQSRWQHRASVAAAAISAKPVRQWPSLLAALWAHRGGRRLSS